MIFEEKEITLKNGKKAVLRSPEKGDAAALLDFLKTTSGETEFILRYPEECTMTEEQEAAWIEGNREYPAGMVISCFADGLAVGNCQVSLIGRGLKIRHRATVAIAVRKDYWNLGIGGAMMRAMVAWAKEAGAEQIELEYIEGNERGRALYEKTGFREYGRRPGAIRLKNGEYRQEILMLRRL